MWPSLYWGQEWERGGQPLLWPPHANQKRVPDVTEEGEGWDNVGLSCLRACLPSFSRPWLQAAPETLCTLVPGQLLPLWGPSPGSPQPALGLYQQDRHTCCPLSLGVLITAYHWEGSLTPFPIYTAPSLLRGPCGAPLLESRPWPLPSNKCYGKHHPTPSLGDYCVPPAQTKGGEHPVCSWPPTPCCLP